MLYSSNTINIGQNYFNAKLANIFIKEKAIHFALQNKVKEKDKKESIAGI